MLKTKEKNNVRTSKEIKLTTDPSLKIKSKYGVLDKNKPDILYLRSKANVTPFVNRKDFQKVISNIKKELGKYVKDIVLEFGKYESNFIFTIDISENGITYGKKSHLKYDLYVKPMCKKEFIAYKEDMHHLSYLIGKQLSRLLYDNGIEIISMWTT